MPDCEKIDVYTELLDMSKPVRHIAFAVPLVAFVIAITGRQWFIRFDGGGKHFGAYSIFVHAPANPDNQAIAGFTVEIAMRHVWSGWRTRHVALFV